MKIQIKACMLFALIFLMCGLHGYCAEGNGFFRNERQVFYVVPDQRFQSGRMVGKLNCPSFAWNKDKEPIYGKTRWFDAVSRIEFEPDMELCGGDGDEWNLIWVFEPDPRQGDYRVAEGIARVTIVSEEVPKVVLGEEFLDEMWMSYVSENTESEDLIEVDSWDDSFVEEEIADTNAEKQTVNEKIESVNGTTSGPVKVTIIDGYEGSLLNGLGSSITGVGALGSEYGDSEYYPDCGNETGSQSYGAQEFTEEFSVNEGKNYSSSGEKADQFNDDSEDMKYPEMITYRGELLGSSDSISENGDNSETSSDLSEKREIPQTGDNTNVRLWCSLLGASFFLIVLDRYFGMHTRKGKIR